jgi:hypothetical protein
MVNTEVMNTLINEFLETKKQIEALESLNDARKKELEFYMKQEKLDEFLTPEGHKMSISSYPTERIDTKLIREKLSEEMIAQFIKTSEVTRVMIISKESLDKQKAGMNKNGFTPKNG